MARFIFAFATDQDGTQVITQTKNSLGLANLPSFEYRIIEAHVETAKGVAKVGRLVIEGHSEWSVEDILSDQGSDLSARTSAEGFLRKALSEGPRLTTDVEEEAKHAHSISKRTLERARGDLKIVAAKIGGAWWIALPEYEGDLKDLAAKTAKTAKVGGVGGDGKTANTANTVPQGEVGGLGGLEPDQLPVTGPCLQCRKPCERYGEGGSPLCADCRGGAQ